MRAVAADDAMAGHEDRHRVAADGRAHGAHRGRTADGARDLAVAAGLPGPIASRAAQTARWNGVPCRSRGMSNARVAPSKYACSCSATRISSGSGSTGRGELGRVVALALEPGAGQPVRRAGEEERPERRREDGLRGAGVRRRIGGVGHVGVPKVFHRRSTAYDRQGRQACARASTSRSEAVRKSRLIAFSTATSFGGKASGQPSARIAT